MNDYPIRRANYDKKLTTKTAPVQADVTIFGSTDHSSAAYRETMLGMNRFSAIVRLPQHNLVVRFHVSDGGVVYLSTGEDKNAKILYIGSLAEED